MPLHLKETNAANKAKLSLSISAKNSYAKCINKHKEGYMKNKG